MSSRLRQDLVAKLELSSCERIEWIFIELGDKLYLPESRNLNQYDAVLNLTPRNRHYLGLRRSLKKSKIPTIEVNLGLYRRHLFSRLATISTNQNTNSSGLQNKAKFTSKLRAMYAVMGEFKAKLRYLPDYLLASAPRNLQFFPIAKSRKFLIDAFFQREMEACKSERFTSELDSYILFVDDAVSTSRDWDNISSGRPVEIQEYSREIQCILKKIEISTGLRVIVAGHPGSRESNFIHDVFGKHEVRYGETGYLIRNAKFVLTHQSTAIYQALYIQKPTALVQPKCIERTFYGSLVRSFAKDARIPLLRAGYREEFENLTERIRRFDSNNTYLKRFVGVPSGNGNIPSTILTKVLEPLASSKVSR